MTISFIQIIKWGCQFPFTIYVLHFFLHWHLNVWAEGKKGWKKAEKKDGKHFSVACVMIVRWHIASVQFLDAKVWHGWYFPHEKYYWLQLEKLRGWNLPDSASLHGCWYGHGFVDVIGENSRSQTIICVVGSFYHFLNSFELHDLLDWAKNLLTDKNVMAGYRC